MRGDTQQLERYHGWVEQWSSPLYRLAYRLCGRADIAEDLIQETFFQAWRSRTSLRDEAKIRPWLYRILRHCYARYIRSQQRRPHVSLESTVDLVDPRQSTPLEQMTQTDSLQSALDLLEDRYRLPLLMVFLGGMTCQEAADELRVPLGTVLSRIHRGRQFLRQRLGQAQSMGDEQPEARLRLRG